jgi:translation elongation factor EF-G
MRCHNRIKIKIECIIEVKQNEPYVSYRERITRNHTVVSSGGQDITLINIAISSITLFSHNLHPAYHNH